MLWETHHKTPYCKIIIGFSIRNIKVNQLNYYIFGAHPRGYTLYQYLKTLEPNRNILGFFYDNDEENPDNIEGIKVIKISDENNRLEDSIGFDLSAEVFVATRGVFHEKIISKLKSIGFKNVTPVTPSMDTELRNRYVKDYYASKERAFEKISDFNQTCSLKDSNLKKTCIYIAKTIFDQPFQQPVELKDYERIIQAGSALSENKLTEASFYDDNGENISNKNQQFCELTALYWIWKHSSDDIIGFEHWRRRFILPEKWDEIMLNNGIDVILPVPLCVMPSLEDNYKSRHDSKVWEKGMEILKKHHPEDYEVAVRFFKESNLYSPCNMIIAKREVLKEYCDWLFPVLLELNDTIGILDDKYQNRYPGFISERLLNYFFEKNQDRFKIVYADKSFLS